jgi:UV DNA damage repair endonuclease
MLQPQHDPHFTFFSEKTHISSRIEGWDGPKPERHHDFINVKDFPKCWHGLDLTVEVEAKAKEVAVLKLKKHLEKRAIPRRNRIVQKSV